MGSEAAPECKVEGRELVQQAFQPLTLLAPIHGTSDSKATLSEQQNQGLSTVNLVNDRTKVLLCTL
jgi:hypothetical protein